MAEILEALLSEDNELLKGKVAKNKKKYEEYLLAINAVEKLKQQGLCSYTYRDPDIVYDIHIIEISWNFQETDDDIISVKGKRLSKICRKMDSVTFDANGDYWQVSIKIYTPA